tara:strand:+ start:2034 stop:2444 length:411 start_codon:yes stop_codon:yes gene_type:complete
MKSYTTWIYLSKRHILKFHSEQLAKYGGAEGIRDHAGLESAIEQAKQTAMGEDCYPTVYDKASAYCFFISQAQAFVDGNKRVAVDAALTFLRINGVNVPQQEMRIYEILIEVAEKKKDREDIADLFRDLHIEYMSE